MQQKTDTYALISAYYLRASDALDKGMIKEANTILYDEMPMGLYDISIDLWADRNYEKLPEQTQQLINLIKKVDEQFGKETSEKNSEEEDDSCFGDCSS